MRNVKSDQPRKSYTTPPQRKEERREIALHRATREFYLHQGINKETKKLKPKSFDTESHSSSNSSHSSKFNFLSPLEKETEVIQNNLENSNEKDFQKPAQRAYTKSNPSLCNA